MPLIEIRIALDLFLRGGGQAVTGEQSRFGEKFLTEDDQHRIGAHAESRNKENEDETDRLKRYRFMILVINFKPIGYNSWLTF